MCLRVENENEIEIEERVKHVKMSTDVAGENQSSNASAPIEH